MFVSISHDSAQSLHPLHAPDTSPSTAKDSNQLLTADSMVPENARLLYSPSTDVYWKMNHLYDLAEGETATCAPLDGQIESEFLVEHRSVVRELAKIGQEESEKGNYQFQFGCEGAWGSLSRMESEEPEQQFSFFQILCGGTIFTIAEAKGFSSQLERRPLWDRITKELCKAVPSNLREQFLYIFYLGFKNYIELQKQLPISLSTINSRAQEITPLLVEAVQCRSDLFSHLASLPLIISQSVYTIMAAANGSFQNRYYNPLVGRLGLERQEIPEKKKTLKKKQIIKRRSNL